MTTKSSSKPEGIATSWLTEVETSSRLGMSVKWLQKMRLCGGGIPFAKFGSAVRYAVADIENYERRCLRQSTSDPGPQG